ncbi:FapA family protein [Alkaliphilus pronyensis]|uniref:FapA family protein n=1 Tax=Alkaliphilus pronyensis TaxID=1482732 RepID=A0A6I0FD23_9FIRM|nr:FapA family protein [Alkaliphilus pronyensis]KAB3535855.1 FapA family protein [Alkaliphilus pronyensis]
MEEQAIIIEGVDYDEALDRGLNQLDLTKEEVDVVIIEEKKGFLFKKGYIKIKITPKDSTEEVTPDAVINKDIEALIDENSLMDNSSNATAFNIDYREDGVYLDVTDRSKGNEQSLIDDIAQYVKEKKVTDYDILKITMAVKESMCGVLIAPPQEENLIDSTVKYDISKDRMEARIALTNALGGKFFTLDSLKEEIDQYGIKYGISDEQLLYLINNKLTEVFVPIARGKDPVNGIDGKVIYHFDTSKVFKPVVLEDGTVDHKTLNLVKNVKKGDLLAEIIPPTEGVIGYDVMGRELKPKQGKEARYKAGKNTVEGEDSLKLYSSTDGQVSIEDGKITVSEVYNIIGNVDNSTGNINFNGSVVVKGNVKSGFVIRAEGNIEVHGVVEGATLIAKGDILLNRGVQGNYQCYLECNGNLIAKYIENAKIKCNGNLQADCILHSEVFTKGKILLTGKKSLVVGGDIKAGEELRTKTIGSHMGTITKIEVGADPEERAKLEEMRIERNELEKNLSNLKKTIDLLSRISKTSQLPKSKQEVYVKSIKTYEFLLNKHEKLVESYNLLEAKIHSASRGKVHVSDTIYPGVKVTILNATRHFNDEAQNCTLYKKEGDVTIGPYER